ncbi:hypothetical protein [Evansella clarkii]|uniref:hypothetical protein n=1 Tax=Evansella clarkii TaxID=79879 RepID=UPI000996E789|nr:hypothetical protein [Evansella clarkii]
MAETISVENQLVNRLNDLNDDYNTDALVTDESIDRDTKLKVLHLYGKQFSYGHSAAWTEAMALTLDVLDISIKEIN